MAAHTSARGTDSVFIYKSAKSLPNSGVDATRKRDDAQQRQREESHHRRAHRRDEMAMTTNVVIVAVDERAYDVR